MEKQITAKRGLTRFAKNVYRVVARIPLGEVRSYKWVARKAGRPNAARSVGQILKRNPLPLIIPCHRVVNTNGRLGGYLGGKKTKQRLLELEKEIKKSILTIKKSKK
jgi:methylated-DNA-[protein]-cysteine S-methyltransferase